MQIAGPLAIPDAQAVAAAAAPNLVAGCSNVRDGAKIVAIGLNADGGLILASTASATQQGTFQFNEPGRLGRLFLLGSESGDVAQASVSELTINNNQLISGFPTVSIFRPDATFTPKFGHYVENNTRLTITLSRSAASLSGNANTYGVGFSCVPLWDGLEAAARKVGSAVTLRRAAAGQLK